VSSCPDHSINAYTLYICIVYVMLMHNFFRALGHQLSSRP